MKVLITGITGQTGSYLAEYMAQLEHGCQRGDSRYPKPPRHIVIDTDLGRPNPFRFEVHGIIRRSSSFNTGRIDHIRDKIQLHYGDVTDAACMARLISEIRPDIIYNLAAQSHVAVSFQQPAYTAETIYSGTLNVLEAVRSAGLKDCRIYQASSSEMFGNSPAPQNESTPFDPQSPYAIAKVAAHHLAGHYREAHGMKIWRGILFNHESPRRGETFVTRKITRAATRIKLGLQDKLVLGNLDAKRDWGHAECYARWLTVMVECTDPDDFVIGTGKTQSVRDFCAQVFERLDLDWKEYVVTDPKYYRPAEVNCLQADPSKAIKRFGFTPTITPEHRDLVGDMVRADMVLAQREKILLDAGHG